MSSRTFPENFRQLHRGEEELRNKAVTIVADRPDLLLHLGITENVMDMLDIYRQIGDNDEDTKVLTMLGMRIFNAFAVSLKLSFSGYYQNSALILRDILETVFLVDMFRTDNAAIARWRLADKQARLREFRPVKVREFLDERDGNTGKKRAEMYDLFSELAGHPTMKSAEMLRPKGMDARNAPFLDPTALEAVLSETGRLAVQAGELFDIFLAKDPNPSATVRARASFRSTKAEWLAGFYGAPKRAS